MKPNNLEQAKGNVNPDWDVKIPTEINELEAHLYHVLFVVREHDASRETYDTSSSVRKFNIESWQNVKANTNRIGYKHTFILHDPTKAVEVVETKKTVVEPKA